MRELAQRSDDPLRTVEREPCVNKEKCFKQNVFVFFLLIKKRNICVERNSVLFSKY